jgi:hypothetical protein
MDYPNRTRLKVLDHARVLDAREHSDFVAQISEPNVRRLVERLFFMMSCPSIGTAPNTPRRVTPSRRLKPLVAPLKLRMAELEVDRNSA